VLAEWLSWLEASGLGRAVRGAGVWSYAIVNLVHIVGVATLFGSVLLLDLKLLGLFRRTPLSIVSVPTTNLAAAGFALAALSGLCLLSTNGSEYINNPFLLIKFGAIAVGLANVLLVHQTKAWKEQGRDSFSRSQSRRLAFSGGVSLLAWTTAVTAGRMLGYW
jgi:hypothetical protein